MVLASHCACFSRWPFVRPCAPAICGGCDGQVHLSIWPAQAIYDDWLHNYRNRYAHDRLYTPNSILDD